MKKKCLAALLALVMLLALGCPALAAKLPELTFDLSCEGAEPHTRPGGAIENALEYVKTGDVITVYYTVSAASDTKVGVSQDEIYYDHDFFELVPGSIAKESAFSAFYATEQTKTGGQTYVFFNTIDTFSYGAAKRVGSFQLRVKATGGESVIQNTSYAAAQNLDKYPVTAHDLWVGFGEWDLATFRVTLDANGGTLPAGASATNSVNTEKGETLTLPAPTKLFYTFDYWTDGAKQYAAGAEYTPDAHTFLTAHWTEVPAPKAPTGFDTVKVSKPGASDGKITGVTTAMEYTDSLINMPKPCLSTSLEGLKAGTYYIRLKENAAANQPAGEFAEVKLEAWTLRSAPTGLRTTKTSLPDAADGRISGATNLMEYSTTEDFAAPIRCNGSEITGLRTGTYYFRYVFDWENHRAESEAAAVKVEAWALRDAPTGLQGFKTSLPEKADGKITGTTNQMEYSLTPEFAEAKPCPNGSMTGLKAGTYFVRYVFDTANNKAPSRAAEIVVPAGNAPEQPTGLTAVPASAPDKKDGKITGVSALLEYSTLPDFSDAAVCSGTEITGLGSGTYYIRVKAVPDTNTPAGNYLALTVRAVPLAPDGLEGVKTREPDAKDGKITGVTELMEYSTTASFADAQTCPNGEITGLGAGTYYVRVKADPETNTPAGSYTAITVEAGEKVIQGGGSSGSAGETHHTAGGSSSDLAVEGELGEDAVVTLVSVSDAEIAAAANSESGVVGIDLSMEEDTVESAILPAGMIGKVASAVKKNGKGGFALKLTSASLEFDMTALQSLADQAGKDDLQINMLDTGTMMLNDAQYNAIREMSIYGGYNVSAAAGEKSISEFNGGAIRISIPFNIPSGRYADGFRVFYVAPDGALTELETDYQSGMISFTVEHFSDYIIAYSESFINRCSFVDIVSGAYYEEAVMWAVERGITAGTTATTFSPDATTTRAQIVTFLWRAAGMPEVEAELSFTDVGDTYYTEAVRWAVAEGITNGTSADTFSPNDNCTRAQIVTFLWRAMGKPASDAEIGFTDVGETYYTEAVRWAVANGITSGVSATSFAPNATCTRAQAVTFLWRSMK